MRTSLIAIFLCFCISIFSQEGRALKIRVPESTVRAVVVGISDYEDIGIPDLRFAHKDAAAFASYLQSPAGGALQEDHIKILLNESATGGNIHKALYWLVKESKPRDKCIIYFSGHGDVETIYEDEPGHFLVYDSPSSIYQINSLRIDDLERIVNTLANKNESQVIVFTDACRSGKLAGSDVKGSQATAAALANQFANEIKVMSCQANEYSIEGEQWGAGRGIFSFHLIDALVGLADADEDYEITLKELSRYLEDRFDEDLVDIQQTPVIVGDRSSVISSVHQPSMEELVREKFGEPEEEEIVAMGFAERDNNQDPLELFYEALSKRYLIEDDNAGHEGYSAVEYLWQMDTLEGYASKLPIAKGDLISALQDDAQKAINRYLNLDADEMKSRWLEKGSTFSKYAKYLECAAELLTETHYLYGQVRAKALYFSVVSKRLDLFDQNPTQKQYEELDSTLYSALNYQPRSSFINNELGLLHQLEKDYESSISQFEKAIEISPKWALPYNNLSLSYLMLKDYEKCITYALKSIELNSKFPSSYFNLSLAYSKMKKYSAAIQQLEQYMKFGTEQCNALYNMGLYYYKMDSIDQSIMRLEEALDCMGTDPQKGKFKSNTFRILGNAYTSLGDYENAIEAYESELSIKPKSLSRVNVGDGYLELKRYDQAIDHFEYFIEFMPEKAEKFPIVYVMNAVAYAAIDNLEFFETNLRKAIELEAITKKEIEAMDDFAPIRNSKEYKAIMAGF